MKMVLYETITAEPFVPFNEKVQHETMTAEPYVRFDKKVQHETCGTKPFFSFVERRFDTKPVLHRTKKGSSCGYTGRSFLGSVEILFFLQCTM
jgi:hypothetical protein